VNGGINLDELAH